MVSKRLCAGVFLVILSAGAPVAALAQSTAQEERIAASFVLALGRTPTPAEMAQGAKQEPVSLADLMARHRQQLQGDPAAARAVAARASWDALGRAPGGSDAVDPSEVDSYSNTMQRHLRWLADHPAEYEQVLNRAYRRVLQRDAYSIELDYWKRQQVLSFALLAGCIDDWARRNQPGLMATAGVASVSVNSAYFATVRLSPAVAAEARMALGHVPPGVAPFAAALGRNVVAPGAAQVASVGGIHFAAAGSDRLAPTR
jgi:hypothetical protein